MSTRTKEEKSIKKVIFVPHDDGRGGFGVLLRVARALLLVAEEQGSALSLYFLNSSAAADGQRQLDRLLQGLERKHEVVYLPTDNLIRLPKDPESATVDGAQIPDLLRKWVRPLWSYWPCWAAPGHGNQNPLTSLLWRHVDLAISMGVPQLHRVARREGFPSVEVGDWFWSVGLLGCMEESHVSPEVIAKTESSLRMIEKDEFKAKEAWLTLHQAPFKEYKEHLAGSAVKFNVMTGLLWTGDPPPPDIKNWKRATDLRNALDENISQVRGTQAKRIAYVVPGATPVWNEVIEDLKQRVAEGNDQVAILDLNRSDGTILLLENGGSILEQASNLLQNDPSEEMHLALCRASDFGITHTAGGVLGFAETYRPSVLVDEPGHWLGRIQRDQCEDAGLCVVVPKEFLDDAANSIQMQANVLGTGGKLDQAGRAAEILTVGAERELAEYLFTTYLE